MPFLLRVAIKQQHSAGTLADRLYWAKEAFKRGRLRIRSLQEARTIAQAKTGRHF